MTKKQKQQKIIKRRNHQALLKSRAVKNTVRMSPKTREYLEMMAKRYNKSK